MPRTPVLLVACFGVDLDAWLAQLSSQWPEGDVRVWPDIGDPGDVDYVLAWKAPPAAWRGLTSLKAIFSLGAGVDALLDEPALPVGVPVVSMADPSLVVAMREYVLARVLHVHRQFTDYAEAQRERGWRPLSPIPAQNRRVGVMGLGRLGGACATSLAALGFDVAGWSRTRRALDGVRAFAGWESLDAFAARAEILVCLLPLTPQTEGVLNRRLFEGLPRGAHVINVARGAHLVEADLLQALDSGQLQGATLDVFRVEPLPTDHPFWAHPRITVTPHISAVTNPRTATTALVETLRLVEAGATVREVDRAAGY